MPYSHSRSKKCPTPWAPRGNVSVQSFVSRKSMHGFPTSLGYKVLFYMPLFGRSFSVKLSPHPQFYPVWARVSCLTGSKMVRSNISFRFLQRPILHRLAAIHKASHSESDRNYRPTVQLRGRPKNLTAYR